MVNTSLLFIVNTRRNEVIPQGTDDLFFVQVCGFGWVEGYLVFFFNYSSPPSSLKYPLSTLYLSIGASTKLKEKLVFPSTYRKKTFPFRIEQCWFYTKGDHILKNSWIWCKLHITAHTPPMFLPETGTQSTQKNTPWRTWLPAEYKNRSSCVMIQLNRFSYLPATSALLHCMVEVALFFFISTFYEWFYLKCY